MSSFIKVAVLSICPGVYMPRRTTVILDDDVYEMLVRESVRRYGTPRAISKVLNELLREGLQGTGELVQLVYAEKLTWISQESVEQLRREISRRLEER